MKFLFYSTILLLSFTGFTQKKILDYTAYNNWKSISSSQLSKNGNWGVYSVNPHRGDGMMFWYNTSTLKQDSIARAKQIKFSGNNQLIVCKITPGYDTLRQLELKEVKKDKWVRDSLAIILLEKDSVIKFSEVKSFAVNKSNSFIAYYGYDNDLYIPKKKKCKLFKRKNKEVEYSSKGKLLTVYNPITGFEKEIKDVVNYEFGKNGNYLIYTTHKKEKTDSTYVNLYDLTKKELVATTQGFTSFGKANFSFEGDKYTFTASNDTVKENKLYALYYWNLTQNVKIIADTNVVNLKGKSVSVNTTPYFSRNSQRLFFGIADTPKQDEKDTLLKSEKAKLDLWHYQDKRLQPQQLLSKSRDLNKTWKSYIDLDNNNAFVLLSNDTLDVYTLDHNNADYGIGVSNEAYEGSYNWSYPWPNDYFLIDVKSGKSKKIGTKIGYGTDLSPSGKYFVYFNLTDTNLYVNYTEKNTEICITCNTDVNWLDDINGQPHVPSPVGVVGFTEDEKSIILHSEYDIWEFDLTTQNLQAFSHEQGKTDKIKFRLKLWEKDSTLITWDNVYVKGFNTITKAEGIYDVLIHGNHKDIVDLYVTDHAIYTPTKAKEGNAVVFRQSSVVDYPNIQLTNTKIESPKQISDANPQQKDYNWANVEKVSWTSYEGIELDGLIYKPENFDPNKTYPLLVYYYELYADELHAYQSPKPTASIIYGTEYASAGYVVFYPDIRYKEGYPARGAYDCIMSGTDKVLEMYPNIDSTRMGLQGQSWGGYQTAQLITMTNRYKAAMAGAPVSNMFSAYGGIRWGSGLNRQFQYEKTQSRIGKTIWEAPELYVENSPIFHLPNVETPLLIMHNDGDGAVPWYQGIEMFVGMKRLGKPVWMLNYNGDQHNLYNNANRMDLSRRMRQFFDHYLLNAPAPKWLTDGIPATVKGKEYRLELNGNE